MALNSYEHVVYLYSSFFEGYGWTKKQIDEEELEYILDLIVVLEKKRRIEQEEKEPKKFIDDMF